MLDDIDSGVEMMTTSNNNQNSCEGLHSIFLLNCCPTENLRLIHDRIFLDSSFQLEYV